MSGRLPTELAQLAAKRNLRPWNFRWLPTHTITMINNPERLTNLDKATFRVPIKMNKYEIKEYLEKIYGLDVKKVNTMIYEGKTKSFGKKLPTKLPDWKKAIVTLNEPGASKGPPA